MTESSSPSSTIQRLIEESRLHISEKTPSQARPRLIEAWNLAVNSGEDFLAVEAALMMVVIEPQKLQQDWIARAISLAEGSSKTDAKRRLGSLYASLGWKLFYLRQYDKTLEAFRKASGHFKANGTEREVFVAEWSIGKLLRVMGRTDEALVVQNALLAQLAATGAKDGRLFEELAECLHALSRSAEAQVYFELAYKELSSDEWVNDNQPMVLKRLKDLGKTK